MKFSSTRARKLVLAASASVLLAGTAMAETVTNVGGAPMYPSKDIVDNAVNSSVHTTLVAAVQAAGLVDTLKSAGPFTVFAPTNDAFENLPAGTVDTLLKPENKGQLTAVLTYHVVAGRMTSREILTALRDSETGTVELTTVQGGKLTVSGNGNNVVITDAQGNVANIPTYDVLQSNGVIHVIDKVLLP